MIQLIKGYYNNVIMCIVDRSFDERFINNDFDITHLTPLSREINSMHFNEKKKCSDYTVMHSQECINAK